MERTQASEGHSTRARILNTLLFILTGTYIRAKSFALNRRLTARGQSDSVFAVRMASDHLVYESKRYMKLRNEYSAVSPNRNSVEATKS